MMKVNIEPGKYVLAVSGGVDSVVLLDLLAKKRGVKLVVAHFDHGIRKDSAKDAEFVANLAKKYGVKLVSEKGKLGANASEEKARNARYAFLKKVMDNNKCIAIITAHHQDDVIETALINMLRGTGSAGLISLKSTPTIKRPLLNYSKEQIKNYASKHNLVWREDKTNQDTRYLRNHLRLGVVTRMSDVDKTNILKNIDKVAKNSKEKEINLAILSQYIEQDNKIRREIFSQLENKVAEEYLHHKLRTLGEIDRKTISRISVAVRTAKVGTKTNILGNKFLVANREYAWVE